MTKNLYLCVQCKAHIAKAQEALFVDQSTNRPFCSEKCIMDFHTPYMESFERQELEFRHMLGIESEGALDDYYHRHDLFQLALNQPSEVWFERNGIGEEYHTHIRKMDVDGKTIFYILICSYFDDAPSFVYFKCITANEDLASKYRSAHRVGTQSGAPLDIPASTSESSAAEAQEEDPSVQIPQEALEDLELKKSEYLASLLEKRSEEDIPFEEFSRYDQFLHSTLEDPDEVFQKDDERGDEVRTYIKSFQALGHAFFYVAICVKVSISAPEDHEALLPVITFPSTDKELYKEYAVGERATAMIKN